MLLDDTFGFNLIEWQAKTRRKYKGKKLTEKLNSVQCLDKLINWCTGKKLFVFFYKIEAHKFKSGYWDGFNGIHVQKSQDPEMQLFILLHECGHYLTKQNTKGYAEINFEENTVSGRVNCLENEVEAWRRGERLARKLKLNLNFQKLDKKRVECLNSYINFYAMLGKK